MQLLSALSCVVVTAFLLALSCSSSSLLVDAVKFTAPSFVPSCLQPPYKVTDSLNFNQAGSTSSSLPNTCLDQPASAHKYVTFVVEYLSPIPAQTSIIKPSLLGTTIGSAAIKASASYSMHPSARQAITINGSWPGPTLEFNQFDVLHLTLINNLSDTYTAIHFHGARQFLTPQADGVPGLTQCAISPLTSFTYNICFDRSGSYWYHSHFAGQYTDGMFGTYLVKPRDMSYTLTTPTPSPAAAPVSFKDIYSPQYQYDMPLLISDWYADTTPNLLTTYLSPSNPKGGEPVPRAFAINGKFSLSSSAPTLTNWQNTQKKASLPSQLMPLIYVLPRNSQARIRFISAASLALFNITVDYLPMTVIETDGVDSYPYEVNSLSINVAQRVSVLLDLSAVPSTTNVIYIRATSLTSMFDPDQIPTGLELVVRAAIYLCDDADLATVPPVASAGSDAAYNTPVKTFCRNYVASKGLVDHVDAVPYSALSQLPFTFDYTSNPNYAPLTKTTNYFDEINMFGVVPLYPAYQGNEAALCTADLDVTVMQNADYLVPMIFSFGNDIVTNINYGYVNGVTHDLMSSYNHIYQYPAVAASPSLFDLVQPVVNTNNITDATSLTMTAAAASPYVMWSAMNGMDEGTFINAQAANAYDYTTVLNSSSTYNVITGNSQGTFSLPGDSVIELLLINGDTGSHPIHLHGYVYSLISSSVTTASPVPNSPLSSEQSSVNGPYAMRDVVTLPPQGWVRVRFRTDNPGAWLIHCHISWHLEAGLGAVILDNVEALNSMSYYTLNNMVPQDNLQACSAYQPAMPAEMGPTCVLFVENESFNIVLTAAGQAPYIYYSALVICVEALFGLVLWKAGVLLKWLPQLIAMDAGTLIGAVMIEAIPETFDKVAAGTLTYAGVTTLMLTGFLFPFTLEKLVKRGRARKFQIAMGTQPASGGVNAAPQSGTSNINGINTNTSTKSTDSESRSEKDATLTRQNSDVVATTTNDVELTNRPAPGSPSVATATDRIFETRPASSSSAASSGATTPLHHRTITEADTVRIHIGGANYAVDTTAAPALSPSAEPLQPPLQKSSSLQTLENPSSTDKIATTSLQSADAKQVDETMKQGGLAAEGIKRRRSSAGQLVDAVTNVNWPLILTILASEMIDNVVDGGTMAAAYLTSTGTGFATVVGIFMEELPKLTGSFAVFVSAGAPLWKCVLFNIASSSATFVGAGIILAIAASPTVNANNILYLTPFSVGSFLYVALCDLIPILTNSPWTGWFDGLSQVACVILGMATQAAVRVYTKNKGVS